MPTLSLLDSEAEYGKWNDGKGITTRQLGHKSALRDPGRSIRRDGVKRGNGYHREAFAVSWTRYLGAVEAEEDDDRDDNGGDW